jgi:hypothetical protein
MRVETYVLTFSLDSNPNIDNLVTYADYVNGASFSRFADNSMVKGADLIKTIKDTLPKMNEVEFKLLTITDFVECYNQTSICHDDTFIAYINIVY